MATKGCRAALEHSPSSQAASRSTPRLKAWEGGSQSCKKAKFVREDAQEETVRACNTEMAEWPRNGDFLNAELGPFFSL